MSALLINILRDRAGATRSLTSGVKRVGAEMASLQATNEGPVRASNPQRDVSESAFALAHTTYDRAYVPIVLPPSPAHVCTVHRTCTPPLSQHAGIRWTAFAHARRDRSLWNWKPIVQVLGSVSLCVRSTACRTHRNDRSATRIIPSTLRARGSHDTDRYVHTSFEQTKSIPLTVPEKVHTPVCEA